MSCLSFEFLLVGQVLLDEATCSGAPKRASPRPSPAQTRSISSSRRQQSKDSLSFYSSFLSALRTDLGFFEKDKAATASPRSPGSSCSTLYSIPEEEEGEEEDDDDTADDDADEEEEEQRLYALEGPLLRLFKSCFVQFAYLMPMEKASKPSPMYKTPRSLA